MGILKKLVLVSVALSLSACSVFEGKNTFMTYQDLQDKVKTHDTELQDVKSKLDRVDELEAEIAELKKSQGAAGSNQTMMSSADQTTINDGQAMAVTDVAPAVIVPSSDDQASADTTPAPTPTVAAAPKAASTASSNSRYGVQLAAYASRAEAARGWKVLNDESPDTYVNLIPQVNEKQVNGRTMYQLKVGPFLDRVYGVDFCNMLKQKGQDCLVSQYNGQPL